uniref:Serine aminopeptidase S33 domain-containing protein n=1 Tax=Ditylum brightwellii TaxID=49249 RepID=A0A7S4QZ99_9STRA
MQQETVETRGIKCVCHVCYPPADVSPRGVVVIFHGLNAHGRFPTIDHLAKLVASQSHCIAYCLDFPGHGLSPGLRGHVTSAADMVTDGMAVTLYAKKKNPRLPLFLAGQSLGGGVAALVAREFYVAGRDSARSLCEEKETCCFDKARSLMLLNCSQSSLKSNSEPRPSRFFPKNVVAGLLLLAPMVSIAVPKWQKGVLKSIASVAPRAALFPPAENASEAQFNDPVVRAQIENDDLSYRGNLRASSALACLQLTKRVGAAIQEMTQSTPTHYAGKNMPLLCVIGQNDMVVDNDALVELLMPGFIDGKEFDDSQLPLDVALREYDAKHGLLCEKEPVRGWIENDIVTWLGYRTLAADQRVEPDAQNQQSRIPANRPMQRKSQSATDSPNEEEKENRNDFDGHDATLECLMAMMERQTMNQPPTPAAPTMPMPSGSQIGMTKRSTQPERCIHKSVDVTPKASAGTCSSCSQRAMLLQSKPPSVRSVSDYSSSSSVMEVHVDDYDVYLRPSVH